MKIGPFAPQFINPSEATPFQASQWLKTEVLLEEEEMKLLLEALGGELFISGQILYPKDLHLTKEQFLEIYKAYLTSLKKRESFKPPFGAFFISQDENSFQCKRIGEEKGLLHTTMPVLQAQWHVFSFSEEQEKILPMVQGPESRSWGLQFLMPQLFQANSQEVLKSLHPEAVPNSGLFQRFRKWVRYHTKATSFQWNDQQIRSSLRLGSACTSWINLTLP